MILKNFYTQLAARLKVDSTDPNVKQNLIDKINESYKEVSRAHNWEFLKKTADLLTVPNYTTGSASITNNSRTVTLSGATLTSDFKGRYFNPTGDSGKSVNWYKIVSVDTTANILTLQIPIIESTQSGISYTVWKRFYYLNSEVRKVVSFGKWLDKGELDNRSEQFIQDNSNNISTVGVPTDFSIYGADQFLSNYTTGTVSTTQDSQTVTGTGTSWLANVDAGDIFIVGTNEYRVKRVESDTSIILVQNAVATTSLVPHTVSKETPIGIQFYPESDKQYIFNYSYYKKVFNMLNENYDRPEFPEDFDQAILDGAESARLRDMNDPKWTTKFQEYTARVQELKKQLGYLNLPRFRQFSPFIFDRGGYR